jgi:hypothetical protein
LMGIVTGLIFVLVGTPSGGDGEDDPWRPRLLGGHLLLVALAVLAGAACAGEPSGPEMPRQAGVVARETVLAATPWSCYTAPARRVIASDEELAAAWAQIHAGRTPMPVRPQGRLRARRRHPRRHGRPPLHRLRRHHRRCSRPRRHLPCPGHRTVARQRMRRRPCHHLARPRRPATAGGH